MNNCPICNTPLVWQGSLTTGKLGCPNSPHGEPEKEEGIVEGFGFIQNYKQLDYDSVYGGEFYED